jgi:hypothetical protein
MKEKYIIPKDKVTFAVFFYYSAASELILILTECQLITPGILYFV